MNYRDTVKKGVLPNGLTVITDEVPNAVAAFTSVNIGAGSHHDPVHQNGLIHLSEHLAANGAEGFDIDSIFAYAADNVLNVNFITAEAYTSYFSSGLPKDVMRYMDLVTSTTINDSVYTQDHFAIEKSRIIDETNGYLQNEDRQKHYLLMQSIYGDGVKGRWTGGYQEGFDNVTLQDIQEFHQKSYVGSNMFVLASGQLSHSQVLEWADDKFGHLPKGISHPTISSPISPQDIWTEKNKATQTEVKITFPIPAEWKNIRADSGIISQMFQTNICPQIINEFGVYGFNAFLGAHSGVNSCIGIETSCQPEQVNPILERALDLIEQSLDCNDVDYKRFINRMSRTLETQLTLNRYNHEQRHGQLMTDFTSARGMTDYSDFMDEIRGAKLTVTKGILKRALQTSPATFYYGAITNNLPTGEEIQKRDFSGGKGKNIKRVTFNPRP